MPKAEAAAMINVIVELTSYIMPAPKTSEKIMHGGRIFNSIFAIIGKTIDFL